MNEHIIILVKAPSWEQFTALIQVLIWPLTVVICLALFRKHLADVIDRLGSFKAGSSGLEMTFQNKLDEALTLPALKPSAAIAKSGGSINIQGSKAGTPYEQLLELRDVLNHKIRAKANELNIDTSNMSNHAISQKLKEVGGITFQNSQAFETLIELTNAASQQITQAQVNQVRALVYNLDI